MDEDDAIEPEIPTCHTEPELHEGHPVYVWRLKGGLIHREGGPAVIYGPGHEVWQIMGQLHREDGPAVIRPDGYIGYFRHGAPHRTDGPAVTRPDGSLEYWEYGARITPSAHRMLKDKNWNIPS